MGSQKQKNSKGVKEIKCGMCEEIVGAKVKAMICGVCDIRYHIKCAKINDELYDSMKECKTINWACDKCIKTKNHMKEAGKERDYYKNELSHAENG